MDKAINQGDNQHFRLWVCLELVRNSVLIYMSDEKSLSLKNLLER